MPDHATGRPLAGIKVIDIVASPLAGITRYLLELGADVVRIDIGDRFGNDETTAVCRETLADMAANLGKRVERCAANPQDLAPLLAGADLIVEDISMDAAFAGLFDAQALRAANPALVIMTASGFGCGNSFSQWHWSDASLHALSAELSRSGIRGRGPLLPPGEIALQCAVAQAAYCAVLGLYRAFSTGIGDHMDFSALEGAVVALDPGYGVGGSATLGRPAKLLSPDRPVKGYQYPIMPCADGSVRICLLAPRQWLGMFKMMGEPVQFADEKYLKTAERYKCLDLLPAIAHYFADKPRKELEEQGQASGVPIAAMLTLEDCLTAEHIRQRQVFIDVPVGDSRTAPFPNGVIEIDGIRMGPLNNNNTKIAPARRNENRHRPFDGLKVLDLGVIVVGAETGRLLADMGADVVKVESLAFPDGIRQSYLPIGLSAGFGAGHRNKRSLGLNLKSEEGKDLFRRLVAEADVVLSNFKPGTMEALGFGYSVLSAINPRIIAVESSAYGDTGPWSGRMGYGPLVRAAAGLSRKWRYPNDPEGFSDSITIYPDHVAARLGAMGAIALLIRRMRTQRGGRVAISQAEVMLSHLATEIAGTALGLLGIEQAPDAPWGVWQATGEDQWCVITVRNDADWAALLPVLDDAELADPALKTRAARLAARQHIDARMALWMAQQDADAAMHRLQAAGVPAGRMLRVSEQPEFPFYVERRFFRDELHLHLPEALITERMPTRSETLPEPDARPAPLMGEHTFDVMRDWLGLNDIEIGRLVESAALEPITPKILALIEAGKHKEDIT